MSWRPLAPVEYLCDACGQSHIDFVATQFKPPKGWVRTLVAGTDNRAEVRDLCPSCVAGESAVGAAE